MRLSEAVAKTREQSTDVNTEEAIQAFIALYGMLGVDELYDGIATAMQDEGYDETYETIIYLRSLATSDKDEYEKIDDIIQESGE